MYKKLFGFIFILFAVLFLAPGLAHADVQNFKFTSFDGEYRLSKHSDGTSTMQVTERLQAVFPNIDQNRGIERAIPTTYKNNSLDPTLISVTKADGSAWPYTTRYENDNLIVRIGDPGTFVKGDQTYVISYIVKNVISFYDGHDELYWDANGDQWFQTFDTVRARIILDSSIQESLKNEVRCFSGSFGSTANNCTIAKDFDQTGPSILVSSKDPLRQGENLSFVLSFNANTFTKPPTNWARVIATLAVVVLIGFLIPLFTVGFMLRRWFKYGRDPKGKGIIVPEYSPPTKMNPQLADVILSERMRPTAVSATIMQLCVTKYLRVYETTTKKLFGSSSKFELELLKHPSHLAPEQSIIFNKIFPAGTTKVDLTALKQKLYSATSTAATQTEASVVSHGYFRQTPTKARNNYYTTGLIMLVAGFGLLFLPFLYASSLGIVFSGLIVLAFAGFMPARTEAGVHAKNQLLGLKMYMELAEADRIKTLQSPQGAERRHVNPHNKKAVLRLYEQLLPYAILFGIEKDWAKELGALYEQPPSWYHSNHAFNAVLFSQSLTSIHNASLNSFTAPSSSGSSGFSGGGFSGGGGGGGGGGGW